MDRRAFVGAATWGLLAMPRVVAAQPAAKVFRIGILGGLPTSPGGWRLWEGFVQGLRDLGHVEGQNVVIERRYYEDVDRLPALAAELVELPVDVIVAGTVPTPEMARRATSAIPIVMTSHPDPVGSRLVSSLARPGGNVTGLSTSSSELRGKQLQLLTEILPRLSRVAVLSNPTIPTHEHELREVEVAARTLRVRLHVVEARALSGFASAFSAATREGAGALIVLGGSLFFNNRARLAKLAAESRLPAMYVVREYAEAGGLIAYGANLLDNFRRAAGYVDRILKGAKAADLPIEQPTKFELVINLKAAKVLGLTIPPAVLARADEVLQ